MNSSFCNVALSVPLRTTFTYAVPEELRDTLRAGTRVLVPFRKKSLVGVVVELADAAPKDTKIREITRVLDIVPPLTSKLIEHAGDFKDFSVFGSGVGQLHDNANQR